MSSALPPPDGGTEAEATQEFEALPIDSSLEFVPPSKRRQIVVDEDGNTYLEINQRNKYRPPRERRFRRRPKPVVEWDTYRILLRDNDVVDQKLIRKTTFSPVPGENVFLVYSRLHWWSHGPLQLLVVAVEVIATLALLWFAQQPHDASSEWIGINAWLLLTVLLTAAYVVVWIPWAYHYLIVTNLRVMLIYTPPFGLPGKVDRMFVKDVVTTGTVDQAIAKFVPSMGNLLPKVGITGYKILKGDSAGQDDDWYREGIRFVRHAEAVEASIESARAEAGATQTERHNEEMEIRRELLSANQRAAAAAEATRDLMEQYVNRDRSSD